LEDAGERLSDAAEDPALRRDSEAAGDAAMMGEMDVDIQVEADGMIWLMILTMDS
jgi:hypothetical protein